MSKQEAEQKVDPLLVPFIEAKDEAEMQEHLDQLVALVTPRIKEITRRSRNHQDDFGDAVEQVIRALRDCKADPVGKLIGKYERYVSIIAKNVVRQRIRDQHPEYQALKDSLRHVLTQKPGFALWKGRNQEQVCGLAIWSGRDSENSERLTQLLDQPLACDDAILPGRDTQRIERVELLKAIFAWLGHPIRFNNLVGIVFDLKRIVEFTQANDDDEEDTGPVGESPEPPPDEEAEWKEFLEKLWAEIKQLSLLQRRAYLLNFTDGDGQLDLFVFHGVASIRQIGAMLELSNEHFARLWPELKLSDEQFRLAESLKRYDEGFALLWRYLPAKDLVIARMLGKTQQNVATARKKARDRLARRLAGLHPTSWFFL